MSTSDLSVLVNAIDRIEQARNAEGLPAVTNTQLQQKVLDFYSSQGLEVDNTLVVAACQAAVGHSIELSPEPRWQKPSVAEKESASKRFFAGGALMAFAVCSFFQGFNQYTGGVGHPAAQIFFVGLGFALGLSGFGIFAFSLDRASGLAHDRSIAQWYQQIQQAPSAALVHLCKNPLLQDAWRTNVEAVLYRRGLSPTGQSLLAST